MQARQASHQEAGPHEHEEGRVPAEAGGLLRAVTGGFAKELAALREGMLYISAPKNRYMSGTWQPVFSPFPFQFYCQGLCKNQVNQDVLQGAWLKALPEALVARRTSS